MCDIEIKSSILINVINMSAWISRDEVLQLLGLKPQTLYAYVSRRLIAAHPDPGDPRRSLYSRADAERLRQRRMRGRRATEIAESAISWGEAVLPTAISTVAGERLFYRGRDAVKLASQASLEEAAALLWNVPELPPQAELLPFRADAMPVEAALSMLAIAAHASDPTQGRAKASLVAEAALLLRSVAASLGADLADGHSIADGFAARLGAAMPRQGEAIRAALVLMADHELNASTFAARIAASTGASLAAAALSGLATLLGPVHGGATLRVRALTDEAERNGARACVQLHLARGAALPGFGHPLYPDIDPRAAALLEYLPLPDVVADLAREAFAATGLRPNIDLAAVAMGLAFGLPADAPFRLFAAARMAGWLAHAMEQAESGALIRPRARYAGPPLEISSDSTAWSRARRAGGSSRLPASFPASSWRARSWRAEPKSMSFDLGFAAGVGAGGGTAAGGGTGAARGVEKLGCDATDGGGVLGGAGFNSGGAGALAHRRRCRMVGCGARVVAAGWRGLGGPGGLRRAWATGAGRRCSGLGCCPFGAGGSWPAPPAHPLVIRRVGRPAGRRMQPDVALDHDVGRAADQDQMLDVVAPHQHQPAMAVDGGGVHDRKPRLAVAAARQRRCRTSSSARCG